MAKLRKDISLSLRSVVVNPSQTVRYLGIILDSEMIMHPHNARTASTCFYQIRRLGQLRRLAAQPTKHRAVGFSIRYCDNGLLQFSFSKTTYVYFGTFVASSLLQFIWSPARGIVYHVTEHMKRLHRLSVTY